MADAAQVRALAAYKDFLTLRKDANLDIPVLKQAGRSTRGCNSQEKSCLVTYCFPMVYVMKWDEKAGLRRDAVRSQVIYRRARSARDKGHRQRRRLAL